MYREACASDSYFSDGVFDAPEEDLDALPAVASKDASAEDCMNLLEDVRQAGDFHYADPEAKMSEGALDQEVEEEDATTDDRDSIVQLTAAGDPAEPFACEQQKSPKPALANYLPDTLREALDMPKCPYNALFRLALKIRHGPGGCDVPFLKSARNSRAAAKGLNWYQLLGHDCAIFINVINIYRYVS